MTVQGIINPSTVTANYIKNKEEQRRKREFIKLSTISFVVALFNMIFYSNKILSLGLICIEVIVLLFLLLNKKYTDYLIFYVIFFAFSLEFENYVGSIQFFSIKNTRLFGINLGVWLAIPLIGMFILNFHNIKQKTKEYKKYKSFSLLMIALFCLEGAMGFFSILIDDNNVEKLKGLWSAFFGELYNFSFLPVFIISALYIILTYDKKNFRKIQIGLQAILVGCVFQRIFTTIFGIQGEYGGNSIALFSTVFTFAPFLTILPFFCSKLPFPKFTFFVGIIGIFTEFANGSSGKGIIITLILFFVVVIEMFKNRKAIYKLLGIFVLIVGGMLIVIVPKITTDGLLQWKIYNVSRLFDFGTNWLENLPHSPRIRVAEFLNIFIEFINKPLYFFTGKGFMGTIKDHSGLFVNATVSYDAFTDAEWNIESFYSMHEYASILLTFGLPGLILTGKYFFLAAKNYRNSTWLIIGLYWFVIYYGFSFTIGVFGATVFFYSIVETDMRKLQET